MEIRTASDGVGTTADRDFWFTLPLGLQHEVEPLEKLRLGLVQAYCTGSKYGFFVASR
jgi:hypothetical protein